MMGVVISDKYGRSLRFPDRIALPWMRGPPALGLAGGHNTALKPWRATVVETALPDVRNSPPDLRVHVYAPAVNCVDLSVEKPDFDFVEPGQYKNCTNKAERSTWQHAMLPRRNMTSRTSFRFSTGGDSLLYQGAGPYAPVNGPLFAPEFVQFIDPGCSFVAVINLDVSNIPLEFMPNLPETRRFSAVREPCPYEWSDCLQLQIISSDVAEFLTVNFRIVENGSGDIGVRSGFVRPYLFGISSVSLESHKKVGNITEGVFKITLCVPGRP